MRGKIRKSIRRHSGMPPYNNRQSILCRTGSPYPAEKISCAGIKIAIFAVLSITLAAPAWTLDTGAPLARKVISAWEEGARGVVAIPAGHSLREGQEFPVVRRDEIIGVFTLYYIGEFNAWGAFSAADPEVKLREGDTVVVFKSAIPERLPAPPKVWTGRVRYGLPAGMTVLSFVEGGMAEGIKPGDTAQALLGGESAGTYLVINVGEHYSTGMLERIMSEEHSYDEFKVRFDKREK